VLENIIESIVMELVLSSKMFRKEVVFGSSVDV